MHDFPLWHQIMTELIIYLMKFIWASFSIRHWTVTGVTCWLWTTACLLLQTAPPHPEAATLEPFLLADAGLDFGCWTWRELWSLVRVDPSASRLTVNPPTPWATEPDLLVRSLMSLFSLFLETLRKNKTKVAEESWTTNLLPHSRPSISLSRLSSRSHASRFW